MTVCPSSHNSRTATAARSRSSIGAVGAARCGQRRISPARICGAHQRRAFAANIPDRRNVRWSPEVSINRSICSNIALTGFGCWKSGCAVLSGAERNTMRRACFAIRSKAGATPAERSTLGTRYRRHRDIHQGVLVRVRSPRTTSTCGGKRHASGLRASARTCAPVAANRERTSRPMVPVPPITRI
jgi:hypothetical protein